MKDISVTTKSKHYRKEELVKVSEMYYEDNLKQESIARKLGKSKYAVSRMLKKALEEGIIQIHINKLDE